MIARALSASFVMAICLAAPAATAAPPAQYAVAQTVKTEHGQLQILEDARIDRAMEKDLWEQCVEPTFVYYGDPRAFEKNPPAPAKLRQLNEKGAIVLEEVLDENAPIARIDAEQLGSATHPVFQIETDTNVCMGSYSGRAVELSNSQATGLRRLF